MVKRMMFALLAIATAAMGQQQPQFGEKIDVNLVLLDAVVTDARGNQILGLDKDDFIVKENGVAQKIESVDYFTNRRLLNERESKAAFKVERVREDRYFVFFFDKPSDNAAFFDRLALARRAAKDFVRKQLKPNDVVAVVGHDVRLKIYSDFTSNKAQLERAIDETASFSRGVTSAASVSTTGPSILRNLGTSRLVDETGTVYEALQALGDALRPIRARKDVILFSVGIIEPGEEVRGGIVVGESRFYQPMIGALNRADVAVYPVSLLENPSQPPYISQTLGRIAADSNGEFFRLNVSFGPALRRIENMTNGYYLISYYTQPKGGKGFQKVDVAVKNREFKLRARQGYAYGE